MRINLSVIFSLLLTALVMLSPKAQASHFAAVDIKATYIGTGPTDLTYLVELYVYKTCEPNNASLGAQESIRWQSVSLNILNQFTPAPSNIPSSQGDTLDQLCPGLPAQNSCRDPQSQYPGFVRKYYSATITLPQRATDWTFYWNSSARNSNIDNLCNPSSHGITVSCMVNNLARFDISTPEFITPPVPYFCASPTPQMVQFQNGVQPSNLSDSLHVTNERALGCFSACGDVATCSGAFSPIGYDPGYTLANPIPSATPYFVNPFTGGAFFSPTTQGLYVLAFEAKQYDPGTHTLISSTRRDVQVAILNCVSQQPIIDSIPNNLLGGEFSSLNGQNKIRVCAGQTVNFDITATSQSATNKVNLYANTTSAPGSTFSVTGQGTSTAIGSFEWTPNFSFAGNTYFLAFEAVDSTCDVSQPLMLRSYYNVQIEVVDVMDAGPDLYNYCSNAGGGIDLFAMATPTANYRWTYGDGSPIPPGAISDPNVQSPRVYPTVTTSYIVTTDSLPSNSCKNSDTVTVFIDDENPVTIQPGSELVQCRPGYVQLNANVAGAKPRTNYACGAASSNSGNPPEVATLGSGTAYSSVYSPFYGGGTAKSAKTQIILRKKELFAAGMRSTTLNRIGFNFSTTGSDAYENLRISLKCTQADSFASISGFDQNGFTEVYNQGGTTNFSTGWNDFTFNVTDYNWDTSQNLIVEICYDNFAPPTTAPEVVYTYANFPTMIRTTSATVDACPLTGGYTTPQITKFRPYIRFQHIPAPEVDFTYTWAPGSQLDDSTKQNPVAYVSKSTRYTVTIIGANGCPFSDTVDIFMPNHNYELYPKDTSICEEEKIPFQFSGIGGGATFQWYQNNFEPAVTIDTPTKQNAIASPPGDISYTVVITDSVGCNDTLSMNVDVRPFPIVNIINNDTTIVYGESIQLLASGGTLYQWYPAGTLNNPIIPNPIAKPLENTIYTVRAIGTNGCANSDSVLVRVNKRAELFVPTAFSPNGDGKNDIFRLHNRTFQKLIEFRIFNRYGQQIFSTIDPNQGWDGKWKGVPQDIGTYYYIIRVAYPDGFEETYKGDVTLVK